MSSIALGYLENSHPMPDGLCLTAASGVFIVSAQSTVVQGGRARLSALQSCFDAGLDVLPLALRHAVSVDTVQESILPNYQNIKTALQRIRGFGQLSLSLRKSETALATDSNGRSWLAARLRYAATKEADKCRLRQVAISTGYDVCDIVETRQSFMVGLRVPRNEYLQAVERLRTELAHFGTPEFNSSRFTISGLWPALGFANLCLNQPAQQL